MSWRASADAHAWGKDHQLEEPVHTFLVVEHCIERLSIYNDGGILHIGLQFVKIFQKLSSVKHLTDEEELVFTSLEPSADSNICGSLDFVTSQHPNLDSCSLEGLDGHFDVLLELVFNTCYSKEIHLVL